MDVTYHVQISAVDSTMLGVYSDGISGQYHNHSGSFGHAIGKAIRPLFADLVTDVKQLKWLHPYCA